MVLALFWILTSVRKDGAMVVDRMRAGWWYVNGTETMLLCIEMVAARDGGLLRR